jgi:NifU-like protein
MLEANVTSDFASMGLVQKIKAVEATLDESVRPMLQMDGGNLELLDIKEDGEHIDVYIRYLGACSTCATGSTGTLFAIDSVLKEKLDKRIRVLPV